MKRVDLQGQKVISVRDLEDARNRGAEEILVRANHILTPSAREFLNRSRIPLKTVANGGSASSATSGGAPASEYDRLLASPEAETVKEEIIGVGKKLWQRQYVDGNGGNISFRISDKAVLCTPTLTSKADLKMDEFCLVDLEGNQLAGSKARTSEILLHLEIYKSVPEAKAVVHCHPPHATAYAITGHVPPGCIIPEYEVFVGEVAVSPYETPGTQKFAETVLPYVKKHNTVLLANHGVVCWADTVTHAEWYIEVVDTYCWTLMLASQLGAPISHISDQKTSELLEIKKKLGIPDPRFELQECQLCDLNQPSTSIAVPPRGCGGSAKGSGGDDTESLVQAITDVVMAAMKQPS